MKKETLTIRFLYGTVAGRLVLKLLARPIFVENSREYSKIQSRGIWDCRPDGNRRAAGGERFRFVKTYVQDWLRLFGDNRLIKGNSFEIHKRKERDR